jgi:hypothetical protein
VPGSFFLRLVKSTRRLWLFCIRAIAPGWYKKPQLGRI